MARGSNRWRLTWVLPIHLMIVGLLIIRGESTPRAIIQGVCVAVTATLFGAQLFTRSRVLWTGSFIWWVASYFMFCATTGGLASSMLVTLGLMVCVVSMSMQRPTWLRPLLFGLLVSGFLSLALSLAHGRRTARRAARADHGGGKRRAPVRRAVRRDGDDGRHLSDGMGDRRRLRTGGARAGRTARRALQRERGSHARPRRHRGAPRPRSEETPWRRSSTLDAHGAQRDRSEDRRAPRDRRRRGRSPPVDRRRVPLVLAGPRRPEALDDQAVRDRARAGRLCSRRAPKRRE